MKKITISKNQTKLMGEYLKLVERLRKKGRTILFRSFIQILMDNDLVEDKGGELALKPWIVLDFKI